MANFCQEVFNPLGSYSRVFNIFLNITTAETVSPGCCQVDDDGNYSWKLVRCMVVLAILQVFPLLEHHFPWQNAARYTGSSPNGHPRKRTALLTADFTSLLSYSNSVFILSRKRTDPLTDTFFASRGCPLTRASTVFIIHPNTVTLSVWTPNPEKAWFWRQFFLQLLKGRT